MYGTGRLPIDLITGTDDLKIFSKNPRRSIFVRDLPYSCTSRDLVKLCSETLQVPVVHAVVCKNRFGRTLQIGYILFHSEEAVASAVETLNGCRFIGRDIRVLAYDPKSPTEPSTTGLVHVSFKTMAPQQPLVTEAILRQSFDSFGDIEHVAIRTHKFTEMGLQGGYGFLTFRLPDQNRNVVEQVRQIVIDGILYDCSWSALHTQKGWDGEDLIVDPRHGLIAAKSNPSESTVSQPTLESSTNGSRGHSTSSGGLLEEAYYAARQAPHSRSHSVKVGAELDYRSAEYRDLEARRRMDPLAANPSSYRQSNPPASTGSYYDKRHPLAPSGGFPLSAFGRRGTLRSDYYGSEGLPAVAHPYGGHLDPHCDPRDPYYDLRGRLGAPSAYPYPADPGAPRYPSAWDYPPLEGRYEYNEYEERRARYGSDYSIDPAYPYHRPEAGCSQSQYDSGMRRGRQIPTYPPRHYSREEQPGGPHGFPYENDYLDGRRGLIPDPYGMTQGIDLLDRDYSRHQYSYGEHPVVGHPSKEFDEYGLPLGRKPVSHPGNRKLTKLAEVDAFGLSKVTPGRNFLSEFGPSPEFLYASEKGFPSKTLEARSSSIAESVPGKTESSNSLVTSSPRDTLGSLLSNRIPGTDPFLMTEMVEAIWKSEPNHVPLEPWEVNSSVPLQIMEVNSDLPNSIESNEAVQSPIEDSRLPGLPKVTLEAAIKQSTAAELDALIDG